MGGNWAADYECIVRLTAYQWEDLCWSSGEAWDGWDGRDSPSVEDIYRGSLGWMPSRMNWCSHCSWTHNLNHHSCCLNLNHFHSGHLFPPAWSPRSSSVQQERWWPQWSCSGGETGSWVWCLHWYGHLSWLPSLTEHDHGGRKSPVLTTQLRILPGGRRGAKHESSSTAPAIQSVRVNLCQIWDCQMSSGWCN